MTKTKNSRQFSKKSKGSWYFQENSSHVNRCYLPSFPFLVSTLSFIRWVVEKSPNLVIFPQTTSVKRTHKHKKVVTDFFNHSRRRCCSKILKASIIISDRQIVSPLFSNIFLDYWRIEICICPKKLFLLFWGELSMSEWIWIASWVGWFWWGVI